MLRNLHVTGNYSFYDGGGIAVSYGANPLIQNVVTNAVFADNLYEDVVVQHTYPPTTVVLQYCLVERGASGLVGIYFCCLEGASGSEVRRLSILQ